MDTRTARADAYAERQRFQRLQKAASKLRSKSNLIEAILTEVALPTLPTLPTSRIERKQCQHCLGYFGISKFKGKRKGQEYHHDLCRNCRGVEYQIKKIERSLRVKLDRREVRSKFVEIFGGECCRCGYREFAEVLEFHHIEPDGKEWAISKLLNDYCEGLVSREILVAELAKCILLCSNCHQAWHFAKWSEPFLGLPISDIESVLQGSR